MDLNLPKLFFQQLIWINMKNCIISQPRYLPAISYLQRYFNTDIFILYDIIQRQYLGWENRNQLLINNKPKWLSIPISSSRKNLIKDSIISFESNWINDHKNIIFENYKKHPHFSKEMLDLYYLDCDTHKKFTTFINQTLINVSKILSIKPKQVLLASEIENDLIQNSFGAEKLKELCIAVKAEIYISGSNGTSYGSDKVFENSNIKIYYNNPINPEYIQPNQNNFVPFMGFFDYIFCCGVEKIREIISSKLTY